MWEVSRSAGSAKGTVFTACLALVYTPAALHDEVTNKKTAHPEGEPFSEVFIGILAERLTPYQNRT